MTKKEAVENHRKQWNWMAKECLKQKRVIDESEYFKESEDNSILLDCYCCDYDDNISKTHNRNDYKNENYCTFCPIKWKEDCTDCTMPTFAKYYNRNVTYEEAARIAQEIANLPEREDFDFEKNK